MDCTETIRKLFAPGKGIFANDASVATLTKRFEKYGIEASEENRNAFRKVFYGTPEVSKYISGVILNEEGIALAPLLSAAGIEIGVKVDEGLAPFGEDGEFTTKGIDSLDSRLASHKNIGASFVKWRAAFTPSVGTPSDWAIEENVRLLVEYARIALQHNLVPIVEPEVLMEGDHSLEDCAQATKKALTSLFKKIDEQGIDVTKIVLKTNMILPGITYKDRPPGSMENRHGPTPGVGEATVDLLQAVVPKNIGGVVFLSGGQSGEQAIANLSSIRSFADKLEFPTTFSFERVFEEPMLAAWGSDMNNVEDAQKAFLDFARKLCAVL